MIAQNRQSRALVRSKITSEAQEAVRTKSSIATSKTRSVRSSSQSRGLLRPIVFWMS